MEINFDVINSVMRWIVLPTAGVVIYIYNRQNKHHTDIEVLKAQHEANKSAHDKEMKEMRETIKAIFNKLDNIEQALRK
jgi:esterase/lipase